MADGESPGDLDGPESDLTLLHYAACQPESLEAMEALLQHGADMSALDADGDSVFDMLRDHFLELGPSSPSLLRASWRRWGCSGDTTTSSRRGRSGANFPQASLNRADRCSIPDSRLLHCYEILLVVHISI